MVVVARGGTGPGSTLRGRGGGDDGVRRGGVGELHGPTVPGLPGGEPRHRLPVPHRRRRTGRTRTTASRRRSCRRCARIRASRAASGWTGGSCGSRRGRRSITIGPRRAIRVADGRTARAGGAGGRPDPRRRAVGSGPRAASAPAQSRWSTGTCWTAVRRDRGADGVDRRGRPGERVPGHQEAEGADPMNAQRSEATGGTGPRRIRVRATAAEALPDAAAAAACSTSPSADELPDRGAVRGRVPAVGSPRSRSRATSIATSSSIASPGRSRRGSCRRRRPRTTGAGSWTSTSRRDGRGSSCPSIAG